MTAAAMVATSRPITMPATPPELTPPPLVPVWAPSAGKVLVEALLLALGDGALEADAEGVGDVVTEGLAVVLVAVELPPVADPDPDPADPDPEPP
jgi:hypothetical protein